MNLASIVILAVILIITGFAIFKTAMLTLVRSRERRLYPFQLNLIQLKKQMLNMIVVIKKSY